MRSATLVPESVPQAGRQKAPLPGWLKKRALAASCSMWATSQPSQRRMRSFTSGPPAEYWPSVQSERTTRWQGTTKGTGLCPKAVPPMADSGGIASLASDPAVGANFAAWDGGSDLEDAALERRELAEIGDIAATAATSEGEFHAAFDVRRRLFRGLKPRPACVVCSNMPGLLLMKCTRRPSWIRRYLSDRKVHFEPAEAVRGTRVTGAKVVGESTT